MTAVAGEGEGGRRLGPEWLFLGFALAAGLILTFLITPLAGGNEVLNFQRAATIASGEWRVRPATVPAGIAELLDVADARFAEGSSPPYVYSPEEEQRLRAMTLRAGQPRMLEANPIAVLNPLAYLPQVPAMAAAQAFGAGPLTVFLVGRLAGLAAAVLLTFLAIRLMPVRRYALAALALLPPMTFARSTLDADQFNTALALLFTALALRSVIGAGMVRGREIAVLALVAFVLAQAKSAYLLMPLLAFAIPAERFPTRRQRWLALAAIALPGPVASVGWMLLLKADAFTAVRYSTWSGVVEPDRQLALILGDPFGYAMTLLRTLFATDIVPRTMIELFGTFRMPPALTVAVMVLFALVVLAERPLGALRSWRLLSAAIIVPTVGLILTLLYLQWTQVGGPVVHGWNGRYLYPLGLLIILLPTVPRQALFGARPERWLLLLATVSLGATLWTTAQVFRA